MFWAQILFYALLTLSGETCEFSQEDLLVLSVDAVAPGKIKRAFVPSLLKATVWDTLSPRVVQLKIVQKSFHAPYGELW